ncbi:MAG: NAD-dependent epimerase/dehydratase family protein [Planctomycetota bacterium]
MTGGAGYVGSRLVPALLDAGHRVRVVDKLLFGADGLDPVRDRIELVVEDIRHVGEDELRGVDAIVHLAGLSNDPTAEYNVDANRSMNRDATIHLGELARRCGVPRFVFASSCSIYYTLTPDERVRDEDEPVDPQAPYSWSKREAEKGLLALADDSFCPVALRKGTIYGQSPRMRYDLVVNAFTRDAYAKRRLSLHAMGKMWRPMLSIDDAVSAYLAVLHAPAEAVHGRIFNAVGDNYTVVEIARTVRRTLETRRGIRLDLDLQPVGTARSYRVSADRMRDNLGFRPANGMAEAVKTMWDVLEAGVDVDHPIYHNIRWLELLSEMEERLRVMGGSVFEPGARADSATAAEARTA